MRHLIENFLNPFLFRLCLYPLLHGKPAKKKWRENGNIIFEGLDPYVYYVDVFEENFDNWALGAADAAYIRTPQLVENSVTTFTAWVEYVAGMKAEGKKRNRAEVISAIERKKE